MAKIQVMDGVDTSIKMTVNTDGSANISLKGSDAIVGVDIQKRYAETTQTHNAVSVPLSAWSGSPTWIDCDGFDKIAVTMKNDASTASSINIYWSNDASSIHADQSLVPSDTNAYKTGITDIRARYAKIYLLNGDATVAHTMSAFVYLKA